MGVCPICRDDPNKMQRGLYCSGLLLGGKDYEITHCGGINYLLEIYL